jgi:hypothetical protein
MLTAAWLLVSLLAPSADARRPDFDVRAAGGAVTIHARNLPLSQILDRLSAATGMTLNYEGTHPGIPVSLDVENVSETEAVMRLMEGLGISYVYRTDASGQRVDLLIVAGAGGGGPVMASSSNPPEDVYEEPVGDYAHIPLDPAVVEAAGGAVKPDLNNPYLGLPTNLFPQAAPGYQPPPSMDDPTGSSGSRSMPAQPSFPQAASFPRR